jgi:hypothetical protein
VTHVDISAYQREAWSNAEIDGYDELMDMSQVGHLVMPSVEQIRELARLSAGMDNPARPSRFAIYAPTDLAFGLGRMYEVYRSLDERSTKQISVFRSLDEAMAFLDRGE